MEYNYIINIEKFPISILSDIMLWCDKNLIMYIHWNYYTKSMVINGEKHEVPTHLFLANEEDITAMKLVFPGLISYYSNK